MPARGRRATRANSNNNDESSSENDDSNHSSGTSGHDRSSSGSDDSGVGSGSGSGSDDSNASHTKQAAASSTSSRRVLRERAAPRLPVNHLSSAAALSSRRTSTATRRSLTDIEDHHYDTDDDNDSHNDESSSPSSGSGSSPNSNGRRVSGNQSDGDSRHRNHRSKDIKRRALSTSKPVIQQPLSSSSSSASSSSSVSSSSSNMGGSESKAIATKKKKKKKSSKSGRTGAYEGQGRGWRKGRGSLQLAAAAAAAAAAANGVTATPSADTNNTNNKKRRTASPASTSSSAISTPSPILRDVIDLVDDDDGKHSISSTRSHQHYRRPATDGQGSDHDNDDRSSPVSSSSSSSSPSLLAAPEAPRPRRTRNSLTAALTAELVPLNGTAIHDEDHHDDDDHNDIDAHSQSNDSDSVPSSPESTTSSVTILSSSMVLPPATAAPKRNHKKKSTTTVDGITTSSPSTSTGRVTRAAARPPTRSRARQPLSDRALSKRSSNAPVSAASFLNVGRTRLFPDSPARPSSKSGKSRKDTTSSSSTTASSSSSSPSTDLPATAASSSSSSSSSSGHTDATDATATTPMPRKRRRTSRGWTHKKSASKRAAADADNDDDSDDNHNDHDNKDTSATPTRRSNRRSSIGGNEKDKDKGSGRRDRNHKKRPRFETLFSDDNDGKSPIVLSHAAAHAVATKEWKTFANDAIHCRLIHKAGDMSSDRWNFHPAYTHQLWRDEHIYGYKGLHIDIFSVAGSLFTMVDVRYREKLDDADDIVGRLNTKLRHKFGTDRSVFQREVEKDWTPPGVKVHDYQLPSLDSVNPATYEVYRGDFSAAGMKDYHHQLQLYLLFFIERSSLIDTNDPMWEVLLICEKRTNHKTGRVSRCIVGYTTLYQFLLPSSSSAMDHHQQRHRLRVSQILILPPYQRKGHGQRLLELVYKLALAANCVEVTVEDPSPAFQFVRDLTDIALCRKHGFFQKKKGDELDVFNEDVANKKVRAEIPITMKQVRRCYEIFKLASLDMKSKTAYPEYVEEVKHRLTMTDKYAEQLGVLTRAGEPRDQRLEQMYHDLHKHYQAIIKHARIR